MPSSYSGSRFSAVNELSGKTAIDLTAFGSREGSDRQLKASSETSKIAPAKPATKRMIRVRDKSEPPAVAGGLFDCGFRIWECGFAACLEFNPKSAFRNPKSPDPPATAGGSDTETSATKR